MKNFPLSSSRRPEITAAEASEGGLAAEPRSREDPVGSRDILRGQGQGSCVLTIDLDSPSHLGDRTQ